MDTTNDLLYQAVKFYQDNLAGRKFEIIAERNKTQNILTVSFDIENFFHLLGLHKLIDIPLIQRSSRKVYHEILKGKITYNDISSSVHFSEMEDRLIHHQELLNVLNINALYFKSLRGEFKTIKADYFLCNEIVPQSLFSFLFIKSNSVPVSFFTRSERNSYIRNSIKWTILSIKEINSADENAISSNKAAAV